jgi:hypothetical protein
MRDGTVTLQFLQFIVILGTVLWLLARMVGG